LSWGGARGVTVNTNLGGTTSALEPGGYNLFNTEPGIYTVLLSYDPGAGYAATLTKTGNLPPVNYSQYQMDIIGDAYLKQDGTPAAWDESYGKTLPAVTGTNYTWTYNINFLAERDFKFRQGDDWSGLYISFPDVTMAGTAASYFTNDGGNFHVSTAGNYIMVLKVAAATGNWTVTATKN